MMPFRVPWRTGLGARKAVGSEFSPLQIAGLQLWLDFSDATKLFTDAGTTPVSSDADLVYQANDKSGNNWHFTQATSGNRPAYKVNIKNGLSVCRFDGADNFLSYADKWTNTGGLIIAVLATNDDAQANQTVLAINEASSTKFLALAIRKNVSSNNRYFGMNLYGYGTEIVIASTTLISTGFKLLESASDGSAYRFALNGSSETKLGSSDAGQWWDEATTGSKMTIGANYWSGGPQQPGDIDIGEILVYNADPAAADLALLRAYLNKKWSVY